MTQHATDPTGKIQRHARTKWVPIAQMRVSPTAQREINEARIDKLVAEFDPEQIGMPTVNLRDGHYYVIDGQHRVEALRRVGWGDQNVFCNVYEGLSDAEEADTFLKINDTLTVDGMARFKVGLTAGRPEETEIDRVVRAQGLVVSRDRLPGAIAAVGTLQRVYRRSDSKTLGRALRIIRDSFGDAGLEAPVIDGIGLLCQRYNGELADERAVSKLSTMHGGAIGLLGKAEVLRRQTGNGKAHCVAAAAVEVINSGKGGNKLASWWKADA